MSADVVLAIAGALSGTGGSIITAFSVNGVLRELYLAQQFFSFTAEALATNQPDVPVFTGTERRFKTAETRSARKVWFGVILLALGFILQAGSVLLQKHI